MVHLTRRDFVLDDRRSLSAAMAGIGLARGPAISFEEVPPEKSGIKWVHSSGKSPEKYLPKSSGSGLRISRLPTNDGWMDIYLVNSGMRFSSHRTLPA